MQNHLKLPEVARDTAQQITQFVSKTFGGIEEVLGDDSSFVLYPQRYKFYVNFGGGLQEVHLTTTEFRVMEYLMRKSRINQSRKDIAVSVLGENLDYASEYARNGITKIILRLRKKLGMRSRHITTTLEGYVCDVPNTYGSRRIVSESNNDNDERFLYYKDLRLDLVNMRLYRGNSSTELWPRQFEIMEKLMKGLGVAIPYHELLNGRGDKVLRIHINKLRQKLGDDASNPKYIVNVRGVGYKLA